MGTLVSQAVLVAAVTLAAAGVLAQAREMAQPEPLSPRERTVEQRAAREEARPWIEAPTVTVAEAQSLLGRPRVHVLDVTCAERVKDLGVQLPGARWRDCTQVEAWAPTYSRGDTLLVYCACRDKPRSARVVQQLRKLGFDRSFHLEGGLDAWEDAGFPLERRP